ncbi:MAG: 30S ribosomal protein S17 [Sedimentisphaerales bacterium]|nr:30S ribosomal protein S17 [Sedimentisphaerales bacterium]
MPEQKNKPITAAVVSKSGNKSVKVAIEYKVKHPKYGKYVKRRTTLIVHDELNVSSVGDIVEIIESRPHSKSKSWRLVKVLEHIVQE